MTGQRVDIDPAGNVGPWPKRMYIPDEGTPRLPHDRTYTLEIAGQTRTAYIAVDERGFVTVSEELLHQLMTHLGFIETTKDNA